MQNYPVTREWNEADWLNPFLNIFTPGPAEFFKYANYQTKGLKLHESVVESRGPPAVSAEEKSVCLSWDKAPDSQISKCTLISHCIFKKWFCMGKVLFLAKFFLKKPNTLVYAQILVVTCRKLNSDKYFKVPPINSKEVKENNLTIVPVSVNDPLT